MKAQTIDEVLHILEVIIEQNKQQRNANGYFAALYYNVTAKVKEGIANGTFEDGARMERLDVHFANRYLEAYDSYSKQEPCSASWQTAFSSSTRFWPIVLQHLLAGINAHINLDLAIAAEKTCPGNEIETLHNDFDKINEILSELVDEVESRLSAMWPFLKVLLKVAGHMDTFLINFSMKKARDGAWKFAKELASCPEPGKAELIRSRDVSVAGIADLIFHPGFFFTLLLRIIRIGERFGTSKKIQLLVFEPDKSSGN